MNDSMTAADLRTANLRSLADVRRGETVRIQGILFGALRELCSSIGIQEGDDVRCRGASRAAVLLETPNGRTAILDSDWARFIQISAHAAATTRDHGEAAATRDHGEAAAARDHGEAAPVRGSDRRDARFG